MLLPRPRSRPHEHRKLTFDLDEKPGDPQRIALGGVATRPWRAGAAEALLIGKRLTQETALAAGRAALSGARAGYHNGFKIELGASTVADALMIAAQRNA